MNISSLLVGQLVGSLLLLLSSSLLAAEKPNIIVILVDDMGYSDIGCYGGEISTPNLDRLAQNGVRFTQFYNTARCCPTRASLLTGLYPHQAGVGHMTEEKHDDDGKVLPGYSGRLNDRCATMAEVLNGAGYFTAMTGKWHVGQNHGVTPSGRGFQRSLHAAAGGFYFPDSQRAEVFLNGKSLGSNNEPLPKQWYSTDLWIDYGLKFIDEARDAKQPFFLYVGHNAPHFPLQAPPEDIARWRGKFKAGWDKLREERYQRQQTLGIVDKAWPLSPRLKEVPAWDSLTAEQQDRYDHLMAIYAAVIERMDRSIGTLVAGLKERGELANTLILFMSDNGGNAEAGVPGRMNGEHPGDAASDVFVGQCWATLNNTPFVRYKHFTDEGGISTPLIAHWPAGTAAGQRGQLTTQPGHLIDILATCVDVAGAKYPHELRGKPITPYEGVSLTPALQGKDLGRKQPLFWEHEGNRAIRDGQWKLVALEGQPWRLYDLTKDRTEQHNLASEQPDRVKSLATQWDTWAARADVLPLGGWKSPGKVNKKRRFTLKDKDQLQRGQAPNIKDRTWTLTAEVDLKGTDGVILAQGGAAHGYVLYVQAGKPTLTVRRDNKITRVQGPAIKPGKHKLIAKLGAKGAMQLIVNGESPLTGDALGLINTQPVDGLDVGSDTAGLIDNAYTKDNRFDGTVEAVLLELGEK